MSGAAAFDAWYAARYGERWPALRAALQEPPAAVPWGEGFLTRPYLLDRASVLAALTPRLPPPGETGFDVLDACAAPGGKTLVLTSRLALPGDTAAPGGRLLANELSSERRRRLVKVLDEHLPPAARRRVTVSGFNAAALGGRRSEANRFDAILLDAPCSGERHLLRAPAALKDWTAARVRSLAVRQWALLSACFLLLKPGGSLVYVTCALAGEENDGPAARLLAKYAGALALDPPDFAEGEPTPCGRLILPDRSGGMGPLYVARFRKAPGTERPA